MTATAADASAFLINAQIQSQKSIDKMQLQKLLYLVAGAHHALWGTEAFSDRFQAYTRGPVVPDLERHYRSLNTNDIPAAQLGNASAVEDSLKTTIELILTRFGSWTGPELENYVKKPQSPWQVTRGDLAASASSMREIPDSLISDWFGRNSFDPEFESDPEVDAALFERLADGDKSALVELMR